MISFIKNIIKKNSGKLNLGKVLSDNAVTIIKPRSGWQLMDFKEMLEYRDLFFFLVWRDIKVLYAQTILGFSWAILTPLIQIVIFSIIFGKIAKLTTEGIPYILFSSVAVIPWTYMSDAMGTSSQSLVTGQGMLGKIYFPRLIYPLTSVLSKLVNFGISLIIILCLLFYYRITPTLNLMLLPIFVILMIIVPAGVGMWLSSLSIRFRDVRFAMSFIIRMLMYSAPIVYSAETIPEKYRMVYSLNPIVGVVEGYRACLLGTPMQWQYIWPGMIMTFFIFISGALYFKRMEHIVVDVI
ncbi:MAG: ABC transporter permease [Planctomycetes bacterium]|nr:ABC transporter permease [Planctomycetota bacterium]